ncbi:hypothetical protein QPK87_24030 [Kamptonema cortianum]|nr:hypothetical protein [Oscillatoria laete-virens]MDK3159618.1 hypothetical protein [Kamptonema cortianum]MDL5050266.1 hypothetical protein [Oscillatoria amoena NRMC-F 0135]MDL5055102.1 hypothetical protein [Oscillatoria laete-virens NRMC-F 0139]
MKKWIVDNHYILSDDVSVYIKNSKSFHFDMSITAVKICSIIDHLVINLKSEKECSFYSVDSLPSNIDEKMLYSLIFKQNVFDREYKFKEFNYFINLDNKSEISYLKVLLLYYISFDKTGYFLSANGKWMIFINDGLMSIDSADDENINKIKFVCDLFE